LVMATMVNFHGLGVDVRLEGVEGVGEGRQGQRHGEYSDICAFWGIGQGTNASKSRRRVRDLLKSERALGKAAENQYSVFVG
jgi:hypothetical protein